MVAIDVSEEKKPELPRIHRSRVPSKGVRRLSSLVRAALLLLKTGLCRRRDLWALVISPGRRHCAGGGGRRLLHHRLNQADEPVHRCRPCRRRSQPVRSVSPGGTEAEREARGSRPAASPSRSGMTSALTATPMTNNLVEREIIGRGRKAWLFAGSDAGGEWLATLYTVVRTCQRLAIAPFDDLNWALPRALGPPGQRRKGHLHLLTPIALSARFSRFVDRTSGGRRAAAGAHHPPGRRGPSTPTWCTPPTDRSYRSSSGARAATRSATDSQTAAFANSAQGSAQSAR